jgi:hypothetical protein
MARKISDKTLIQAILFFGFVSFMLGKSALQGVTDDPVLRALRKASA